MVPGGLKYPVHLLDHWAVSFKGQGGIDETFAIIAQAGKLDLGLGKDRNVELKEKWVRETKKNSEGTTCHLFTAVRCLRMLEEL